MRTAAMPRNPTFRVGRSHTGLGLFATVPIEKRTIIVEYRGRRIPTKEARKYERRYASKYMFEIDSRWTIDGSSRSNTARYANHSCRPNAESDLVAGKLVLRAIKAIRPGEEITYDYGREYFDLFLRAKGCKCTKCRTG
jgi:SET domain-containing protein